MADDFDSLDMDDELEESDGGEESGSSGGGGGGLAKLLSGGIFKFLMFGVAAILVVIISIVTSKCVASSTQKTEGYQSDKRDLLDKKPPLAAFDLKQFMVNTADRDETHLVRIKMKLAYDKKNIKLQNELNERRAQIRHLILLFFNDKEKRHMESAQQKRDLAISLMKRINSILQSGSVDEIYYEEFSIN